MEIRLHLLESFAATGSDGCRYKVCAYERLGLVPGSADQWEPTGVAEYRLEDGRHVEVSKDDAMRLAGSGVILNRA
ncbi:hypothetical protein GCM10028796_01890 [Ramlibacter monticola]|uniref:Uncharacterized protein n=1 Tax=Ramlibacter monticola TaxID=1926872 RepID=A0A936YXW9_9BURK|nr:hypothetical protein [Ramlibacter monticola]MBL0391520.1 hypothetical protein [Ramlibacter monticola]